jgi:UDP-N-acetyl-D-mannosaminuronic acid dehydrogenase
VDVWEAISIANLHPRVKILRPGPGVGGHCISVDPWFFVETAPDLATLIYNARCVNDSQPHFALNLVAKALGGSLKGKKIAALGLAFKENVDDLRESPAVELAALMQKEGAQVRAFEPNKPDAKYDTFETVRTIEAAMIDADAIVLLVGNQQFKDLDPRQVADKTSARVLVDMRNALDAAEWRAAGFKTFCLGVNKK